MVLSAELGGEPSDVARGPQLVHALFDELLATQPDVRGVGIGLPGPVEFVTAARASRRSWEQRSAPGSPAGLISGGHSHRGGQGCAGDIGHPGGPHRHDGRVPLRQRRLPRRARRGRGAGPRPPRRRAAARSWPVREVIWSLPPATRDPRIVRSSQGEGAGVVGAARMVLDELVARDRPARWIDAGGPAGCRT